MSRSLPERTVDAWVTAALFERFPGARIWAPTQAMTQTNWDFGASLGNGKVFILEDKATSPVHRKKKHPLDTHNIAIHRRQLHWYCDIVEPGEGVPVYYVLPKPPWNGWPGGSVVVPNEAICRTTSSAGTFAEWAHVVNCSDLRTHLGARSTLFTDTLPLPTSVTLSNFFDQLAACERGQIVRGAGTPSKEATQSPFEEFPVMLTNDVSVLSDTDVKPMIGSALAVFVPAVDLPGWSEDT